MSLQAYGDQHMYNLVSRYELHYVTIIVKAN